MDLNKSDTLSIWFIYAEQPYRILCNCYLLTGYTLIEIVPTKAYLPALRTI